MNKVKYYDETILEYICRILMWPMVICTLILGTITVLYGHFANVQSARFLAECRAEMPAKRELSATQQFWHDVRAMEVPEDLSTPYVEDVCEIQEALDSEFSEIETDVVKEEVDSNDRELLAHLMYAEVGVYYHQYNISKAEYIAKLVGSVVINRKNSHYLGAKTINDVIYAEGQYACTDCLWQEVPKDFYDWAEELLVDGPIGPENMIFQAQFEQGTATYEYIGNQYFCLN